MKKTLKNDVSWLLSKSRLSPQVAIMELATAWSIYLREWESGLWTRKNTTKKTSKVLRKKTWTKTATPKTATTTKDLQ